MRDVSTSYIRHSYQSVNILLVVVVAIMIIATIIIGTIGFIVSSGEEMTIPQSIITIIVFIISMFTIAVMSTIAELIQKRSNPKMTDTPRLTSRTLSSSHGFC